MKKILPWFLGFIAFYHVLNTIIVFGFGIIDGMVMAVVKELLRVGFILVACWTWRSGIKKTLQNSVIRLLLCLLGALFLIGVGISVHEGVGIMNMLVGFKYDLLPIIVVVFSLILGMLRKQYTLSNDEHSGLSRKELIRTVYMLSVLLLVGGVAWQIDKMLFPNFFTALGYGPIGDYVLGGNPPLWYRTGPGGRMRLQGLFAGPNNYGFFLVAMSAFFVVATKEFVQKTKWQRAVLGLYVCSVCATLSRGALIGVCVAVGGFVFMTYKSLRKRIIPVVLLGVVGVIGLSVLKPGSTQGHNDAWFEGINALKENPWGYGLGASGPSVHYNGIYLPENQYLGVALDIGIPGLLVWLAVFVILAWIGLQGKHDDLILYALMRGLAGMMVEGLFLHVFEDSMVNYIFLTPLGLLLGYHLSISNLRLNTFWSDRRGLFVSFFSSFDYFSNLPSARNKERLDDSFNIGDQEDKS